MPARLLVLHAVFVVFIFIAAVFTRYLFDPHVFFQRDYLTLALPVLLLLPGLLAYRFWQGWHRLFAWLAVALIAVSFVAQLLLFHYQRYTVLHENDNLVELLGPHFIVGFTHEEELQQLINKRLIGGVFITARNVRGQNIEELQQSIKRLQQLQLAVSDRPLIIATDQEGGIISRLSPPLSSTPPLSALVNNRLSLEQSIQAAFQYGKEQGIELASIGITANFSPVVDLKIDHGKNPQDRNSLISRRAISSDAQITLQMALAYSEGLQSSGVVPTLKHFPGLGRIRQDTHHADAVMPVNYQLLQKEDWRPFQTVAKHTKAMIMLAHVVLADVDADNPVSFSSKVVQGIIRQQWQHEGVLITDDLTMAAAYDRGLCDVSVKALQAGVDLLLVSYDSDQFYPAMYCAMQALRDGRIRQSDLLVSEYRLDVMRVF